MAVVVFYSQYLIFNLYKPNNPSRQFLKLNFNLICKIVIYIYIYIYISDVVPEHAIHKIQLS